MCEYLQNGMAKSYETAEVAAYKDEVLIFSTFKDTANGGVTYLVIAVLKIFNIFHAANGAWRAAML